MSAKDLYRGASEVEILHEPDWKHTHSHRVGVRGRDSRFMGYTHAGDEWYQGLEAEAQARLNELREKVSHGELVTVRDIMGKQKVRRYQLSMQLERLCCLMTILL